MDDSFLKFHLQYQQIDIFKLFVISKIFQVKIFFSMAILSSCNFLLLRVSNAILLRVAFYMILYELSVFSYSPIFSVVVYTFK